MSFNSEVIALLMVSSLALIESQIGRYPALNPEDCGLSRVSTGVNTDCFEWHKNGVMDEIKDGRNVTAGEAPWVVYIYRKFQFMNGSNYIIPVQALCTGSLFANKFVLTAGHCVDYFLLRPYVDWIMVGGVMYVFSGYKFVANQVRDYMNNSTVQEIRQWLTSNHIEMYDVVDFVIHPNYTNYLGISAKDKENDIAIILLDRQIKVSPYHNNICLPTKDYIEHSNTYALKTGYGYAGDLKLINQLPAQITYNRIQEYNKTTEIRSEPVGQSGMSCAGDSGGPLWQYHMGRAVLLGVDSGAEDPKPGYCINSTLISIRVSKYIDWIIYMTRIYANKSKT